MNNGHSSSSSLNNKEQANTVTNRKFTSYSVFYNSDHKNNFYNTNIATDKKHDNKIQHDQEKKSSRSTSSDHHVMSNGITKTSQLQQPRKRMVSSIASSSGDVPSSTNIESNDGTCINMDHSTKGIGKHAASALNVSTRGSKKSRSGSLNIRCLLLPIAVIIWYILGVVSISTTKMILTTYESVGMTPRILTLQQLFIGMIILRLWMWMIPSDKSTYPSIHLNLKKMISISYGSRKEHDASGCFELLSSGIFFTLGFLFTNLSFSSADASFVETIKASEPISSAGLSVLWKLETLSAKESYSLLGICVGVVISTVGNAKGANIDGVGGIQPSLLQSFRSSAIVMGSNICFSFRGLYQKLFRASPMGRPSVVNDVCMQYLIHHIGVMVMAVLVFLLDAFPLVTKWYEMMISTDGVLSSSQIVPFVALSLVNGLAFTHYK